MIQSSENRIVKLLFSNNNNLQGSLRFTIVDSMEWPENELKSQGIISTHEVNSACTSEMAKLRSIPTASESELDVNTLNTLLIATQSALLLSCDLVYMPLSKSTGSLSRYNPSAPKLGGTVPKSRLAKIVSQCHEARRPDLKHSAEKMIPLPGRCSELILNPKAWLQVLPEELTKPDLDAVTLACNACAESNNPSPQIFVTSLAPQFLLLESDRIDKAALKDFLSKIWVAPETLKEQLLCHDRDKSILLRQIQIQALLRLQLLAMDREMFTRVYEKKLLDRKKRRKLVVSIFEAIISEVVKILESASFLLDVTTTTFHEFLSNSIPESLYCSIPTLIQELFDNFECPNPFLRDEQNDLKEIVDDEGEKPKLKEPKKPFIPAPKKKDSSRFHPKDLTTESIKLVATKRSNPLVKNAKATYVGSHFNTKLANIGVHYHEVPSQRITVEKKSTTPSIRDCIKKQSSPNGKAVQFCSLTEVSNKEKIQLSPLHKGFSKNRKRIHKLAQPSDAIIGETPIKNGRTAGKENDTSVSLFPTSKRCKFDLTSKNLDFNAATPESSKTFRRSSSNARLMALEAFKASRRLR